MDYNKLIKPTVKRMKVARAQRNNRHQLNDQQNETQQLIDGSSINWKSEFTDMKLSVHFYWFLFFLIVHHPYTWATHHSSIIHALNDYTFLLSSFSYMLWCLFITENQIYWSASRNVAFWMVFSLDLASFYLIMFWCLSFGSFSIGCLHGIRTMVRLSAIILWHFYPFCLEWYG